MHNQIFFFIKIKKADTPGLNSSIGYLIKHCISLAMLQLISLCMQLCSKTVVGRLR
jgi:hypothetical protein